jgi:hypothetical protein
MALDLSGFTIPEQKFEGLYKLGEELASQRKAEAAAKALEAKAAKDAAKELKANQASNLMWLKNATDPKAYLTGAPTDSEIVDLFAEAFQKGNQLQLENEGMSTSQLAQAMSPYISNLAQQGIISKNANKAITDATAKLNPKYYDINRANELLRQNTFYSKDQNGNLVKKDLSEVQLTPDLFQSVLKEHGSEIMNSQAIVDGLKSMPKGTTEVTVPLKGGRGTTTTRMSYSPWQQVTSDGKIVPREETAMDVDENGKASPILHNGQEIKVVPDDVYQTLVSVKPETEDWLNSQLHLHATEYGLDMNDTTSPQAMVFKKKLLYDALNPLSAGQYKKATRVFAPSKGRTGGGAGDATGGGQTTGIVFDELGGTQPLVLKSGARVENGSVTDNTGNPYNGEIYVPKASIPTSILSVMKAGGVDIGTGATFIVEDGIIQAAKTRKGITDRNTVYNYQLKQNTESAKGAQPTWGAKVSETAKKAAKTVYNKVKGTTSPISKYDSGVQAKIKAFAKSNNIQIDKAVEILVKANKIKK